MASFIQRLKSRGVKSGDAKKQSEEEESAISEIAQLDVDVYQTDHAIVVYAQVAGSELHDIRVSIEGDGDVVKIEGNRIRPEEAAFNGKVENGTFFSEECTWGEFYRRIILPESVDIARAEAKVKSGVLMLTLPLLRDEDRKGVRLKIKGLDAKKRRK